MFRIKQVPVGLLMGAGAIVLWASLASLIAIGCQRLDVWQFLTCTTAIGSIFQFASRGIFMKNFRSCIIFDARILFLLILFVVDMVFFAWSLTAANGDMQRCNVNLIHYSWPILSVVCAVLLIPNNRFTWQLVVSLMLSIFGLVLANGKELMSGSFNFGDMNFKTIYPYFLSIVGAISWSVYSALICRWKRWIQNQTPVPIALLLSSLVSATVCMVDGKWVSLQLSEVIIIILCGIGPLGVAYTLWESGLRRYSAISLGMMAAGLPVLSTLILCLIYLYRPGMKLILGACLISLAVIFMLRAVKSKKPASSDYAEVPIINCPGE